MNDLITGTYLFQSREQATNVAALARKVNYIASNPVLLTGGYSITISAPKPETTRARSTGTLVTLERGDDLPWMLVCDEHDSCVEFETKTEARAHRSEPEGWCETCAANLYGFAEEVES